MPSRTPATTSHKENLLEGALLCLQERGYARTTARDIVAASGANLGAIGYHYGSTERLLNEALLTGFERWFEKLAAAATSALRESEPLIAIAAALPVTFERNRPMARAFVEAVAQADSSEDVRAGLVECYARGRELLVGLLAPDSPPTPELTLVASFLLAVFDGFLIQWLLDPERAPDAEQMAALASAFSPVLGLEKSG